MTDHADGGRVDTAIPQELVILVGGGGLFMFPYGVYGAYVLWPLSRADVQDLIIAMLAVHALGMVAFALLWLTFGSLYWVVTADAP